MSLFAIADLHLSTDGRKSMEIFGGEWLGYMERLKKNWTETVSDTDTVLVAGDISWGLRLADAMGDLAWLAALPGKKLLLRGNHDLWWSSMAKMRGLFPSIAFIQNDAYEGDNFVVMGSRGWLCPGDSGFSESEDRKIYEREVMRLSFSAEAAARLLSECGSEKILIGAMHYPPTNEKKQPSDFTRIFAEAGCKKVVYGHLHGEDNFYNGPLGNCDGVEYILCSLDKLRCRPMLIAE